MIFTVGRKKGAFNTLRKTSKIIHLPEVCSSQENDCRAALPYKKEAVLASNSKKKGKGKGRGKKEKEEEK